MRDTEFKEGMEKEVPSVSFDLLAFHKRLGGTDRRQQVLNCHLYLEHIINQILADELPRPSRLKLERMAFSLKLDLVYAMGVLPHGFEGPLGVVNRMRNNIAHNLDYEVSDKELTDLENCFPNVVRPFVEIVAKEEPHNDRSTIGLKSLVVLLDFARQLVRREKVTGKRLLDPKSE